MKWKDEVVEEVRSARDAYAAQFDYDLARMFEDLKKKEQEDPAPRAELKPLKPIVDEKKELAAEVAEGTILGGNGPDRPLTRKVE